MTKKYYAHSLEGKAPSDWQPLEEHLKNVAEKAVVVCHGFWCRRLDYLARLWHDLK